MMIQLANMVTGEVVEWKSSGEWKDSIGLKCIRGHIRSWMKAGLRLSDFKILKYNSDYKLWQHLHNYAWEFELCTCDICDNLMMRSESELVTDNEDVGLVLLCKDHDACEKRVNKLTKELEADDDNFYIG